VTDRSILEAPQVRGILEREGEDLQVWPVADRYLVIRLRSGLLIVDQQAAHERVIYERTLGFLETGGGFCQQLLFPQTIDLTASQYALVDLLMDSLKRVGFDLAPFGGNTIVVSGVPAEISAGDIKSLFLDVIDRYDEQRESLTDAGHERLARSVARCSAVGSKTRLAQAEMRSLVDQLLVCESPRTAPDGRRTMITLGEDELARWFGA
jgi:DNA mismatch repair protein MutL